MRAIITFISAIYSFRSGYGRSSSELLKKEDRVVKTPKYDYVDINKQIKHILVHVGFLGVDMDYSIQHLATISCVCWHIHGVLVLVRMCL